ncbi:MAG: hypothetical protein HYW07_17465 [Candidatus Latescibacteria bacterium]|nr:hypothetical protein [Candidatus Latescibacterota bacterium]
MQRVRQCLVLMGVWLALGRGELQGVEIGLYNPYLTTGARLSPESLVPTARKWYLPQTLYTLYGWKGDEYTNYASEHYQRYVDIELEGDRFYDLYGNYISKGWNVYSWNQEYPRDFGSAVFKDPRFSSWFNRVIVSSSSKGQFHTALTVGEGMRTTLTPLTFSKPLFDGLQWDFLTDKYSFTVLASRVDNPSLTAIASNQGASRQTILTQLLGLRGAVDVGDFARVGATYLTAFHQNTAAPMDDNSLRGVLGGRLNAGNVRKVVVRLADDSPEDGRGGALLLRERLFIDGVEHPEVEPLIEGGVLRQGLVEASGGNAVTLTYDIENNFRAGVEDQIADFKEIHKIEVGLVVANDYRIEVASNLQTNSTGEPAFLTVARAPGNITDGSNQRFIRFQYGLPTANELRGLTFEVMEVKGFNLKSEYVSNRRSRRFPNQNIRRNQALAADEASAYYLAASQSRYPFFAYGEIFSMDPEYSTAMVIPDGSGLIDYENEVNYQYEFVEDNDDQDRFPDWRRRHTGIFSGSGQIPDREVFPGLDENNDFISDFNQNQNDQPDYVEPFFRYYVDPPEFLFGVDLNNNTVIDRFENDSEADYPYKRDQRGYNLYLGAELIPRSRFIAGRLRRELHSSARRDESTYALLTLHKEYPRQGLSLKVMEFARRVRDDIADDLLQWAQPPFSVGVLQEFPDPLIAQNTFINTLYLEVNYHRFLPVANKLKLETFHQQGRQAREKRNEKFLGIINKADYKVELARDWELWPQWKQLLEFRTPTESRRPRVRELSEIFFLLLSYRVSRSLWLGLGTEYEIFRNLKQRPQVLPAGFQDDASRLTLGLQFSNTADYLGYRLTSNLGFRWVRRSEQKQEDTNAMAFVDIFAGLGTDR